MMEGTKAAKYGPGNCVETFKSTEGHCIMKTNCKQDDIKKYEFGLVCVDKIGVPVRHIFGKDSFDPKETFDTLIVCDECLGLDKVPPKIAENGQLMVISKELGDMRGMMKDLESDVGKLNKKVLGEEKPDAPKAKKEEAKPAAKKEE